MLIPRRTVRTSQPQNAVGLDSTNPILRGLFDVWSAHDGWRSASGKRPATVPASVIRKPFDKGVTSLLNGSSSINVPLSGGINNGTAGRTLIVFGNVGTTSDSYDVLASIDSSDNQALLRVQITSGNNQYQAYNGTATPVGGTVALGKNVCLAHVEDNNVASLFYQGDFLSSASGTSNPLSAVGLYIGGYRGQDGAWWNGGAYLVLVWNRALSAAEVKSITEAPWQIFEDEEDYLFIPDASGGGSVSLIVADALHGHAVDSPSFSMATYLAVAESLHTHAADNVTLATTGTANLVVQEATHAHVADGVTLTTQWLLAVAEALHSHTADNITLGVTGTANLAIADATSGHTSDTVALTLNSLLAVFDAIHAHSADNLTLDTSNATALTVQDSTHAHGADNLGLSLDTWLAIVEAAHGHTADAPMLSLGQLSLQIADALHAMYSDIVFLTLPGGNLTTDQKFIIRATARRLAAIGLARNNIINRRAS